MRGLSLQHWDNKVNDTCRVCLLSPEELVDGQITHGLACRESVRHLFYRFIPLSFTVPPFRSYAASVVSFARAVSRIPLLYRGVHWLMRTLESKSARSGGDF